MKKIKKQKSKTLFHSKHFILTGAVICIFLLAIASGIMYHIIFLHTKPIAETARNEMKRIPPDVKKEMIKETKYASISATLRVPILMYHYVEYVQDKRDTIRQSLNINPNIFEQQIKTVSDAGYTFITAKELANVLDGKTQLPPNPILLTFDDGHWDLDADVLPILKKYHAKATAYIVSGFIGGSDSLSKTQLEDVIQSGLVEIGAHTMYHASLKNRLLSFVKHEVEQSKQSLEENYHVQIVSFAYPYGAFDKQAINVVKDAGFTTSVSTIPGIEQNQQNRFFLYRIRPGYRTGKILLDYLNQSTFKAYR